MKRLAAALAISVIILSIPSLVSACSCLEFTLEEGLSSSIAVYVGTVLSIEQVDASDSTLGFFVTMSVDSCWLGDLEEEVVVSSPGGELSSCSVFFELGQEYLIFAYGAVDELRTNLCTTFGLQWSTAQGYLNELGEPSCGPVPTDVVTWGNVKVKYGTGSP